MAARCSLAGSRFYRRWSSRAAEVALTTADLRIRGRCARSAYIWTMIADAIDAGDHRHLAILTNNLAIMTAGTIKA